MRVAIIGTGVMGEAILSSLSQKDRNLKFVLSDRDLSKAKRLARKYKASVDKDFRQLTAMDIVILAVKPQDFAELAVEIRKKLNQSSLLFSIAAGVSIKKIQELFSHNKVVRIMPNLGLSVGHGIAVWKASEALKSKDLARAKKVLSLITENFLLDDEKLIDAATAISGSGPAYFFYLADNLLKTAIGLGFKPFQARRLVEKTLLAAAFLQHNQEYPVLIKKIASKRGTTEAALKVFARKQLPKIIDHAVEAAYQRARELSR